jgi:hypothetical protein
MEFESQHRTINNKLVNTDWHEEKIKEGINQEIFKNLNYVHLDQTVEKS